MWKTALSDNYVYFFFIFGLTCFVSLDVLSLFYFVRHLNRSVWPTMWCNFLDISILFAKYWSPMEAMFSSLILWYGLSGAHNLTVLSLRHKDSCIHRMQTLFLEGSKFYLLFLFYRLKRSGFLDIFSWYFFC